MDKEVVNLKNKQVLNGNYGEKAKNLHQLIEWGYCVPDGYAFSISLFQEYSVDNGLYLKFEKFDETKCYILNSHINSVLYDTWIEIKNTYSCKITVRSSAIGEDTDKASAAGIYKSILDVDTYEQFKSAVIKVWNSFFQKEAIQYRKDFNINSTGMGIVIQRMAKGNVSGVIFTINPVCNKEEMIIEVAEGLNENVVSNITQASTYSIEKVCDEYNHFEVKEAHNVKPNIKRVFSENLRNKLCKMALQIEELVKAPCDLEWTIENDEIVFLQLRKITTLSEESEIPYATLKDSANNCCLLDRYALPASILYLSLLEHWQELVYLDFESDKIGNSFQEKPLLIYYNRVYWNINYQHQYFSMAGFGEEMKKKFYVKSGHEQWYEKLPLYHERLKKYADNLDKCISRSEIGSLLELVLNNFCSFIGIEHYRMLGMANICYDQLINMLNFTDNPKSRASLLIQGANRVNMTEKSNHELAELAAWIAQNTNLLKYIDIEDSIEVLKRVEADKELSNKFNSFLSNHGHRGISSDDLMYPHWSEDPSNVIEIIRQLVKDQQSVNKNTVKSLDTMLNETEGYKDLSSEKQEELKRVINLTACYMTLREDQRYYFDKSWLLMRKIFLKVANLLIQDDYIKEKEDVFHLQISEVNEYLKDGAFNVSKQLIRRRKNALKRNFYMTPPYYIREGKHIKIQKESYSNRYKGTVICSGYVEGRVKIVRSCNDLCKVQNNDIIIVPTFHPSWTPILRNVGGMLMNYGNILSHGSVMAREYGIPVVVFNGLATDVFQDGEVIVLDATSGRITRNKNKQGVNYEENSINCIKRF